jgi:hypothetical protein
MIHSWGHSLPSINTATVFCVFLQNPNGLSLKYNNLQLQQDFQQSNDYGVAALCLPKTNVNWNIPDQRHLYTNPPSSYLEINQSQCL